MSAATKGLIGLTCLAALSLAAFAVSPGLPTLGMTLTSAWLLNHVDLLAQ